MPAAQTAPEGAKARQTYLMLRARLAGGGWPAGAVLPGEHALAAEFGVARVTVRRALAALEADGLVARRAGAGTVARAQPGAPIAADPGDLWAHLQRMGAQTRVKLLALNSLTPSPAVALALGMAPRARAQRSVRVRFVGEAPFSHLTAHVPQPIADRFSAFDMAETPLFILLEAAGVRIARAQQSISATLAGAEEAAALDLAPGAPLIAVERVVFDDAGAAVEHLAALYRPDRYRVEMTMSRVGDGPARHWRADG